jgi:hypothetical protein
MKRDNLVAEEDAEATLVEPRFDEEAKEAARPVVPLSQVRSADLYGGAQEAGGPRVMSRHGGSGWPHSLAIMLAVFAVAAVVTATVIYRNARTTAPAAAPQTVNQTTVAAEPQTVERAPEPAAVGTAPKPEPSSAAPARENVARENGTKENGTAARAEPRVVAPAREEVVNGVGKDDERRARDEEKLAERARREERKQAKRAEKEAERMAEKRRDEGKREEVRPRLVGIYTEGRKH